MSKEAEIILKEFTGEEKDVIWKYVMTPSTLEHFFLTRNGASVTYTKDAMFDCKPYDKNLRALFDMVGTKIPDHIQTIIDRE